MRDGLKTGDSEWKRTDQIMGLKRKWTGRTMGLKWKRTGRTMGLKWVLTLILGMVAVGVTVLFYLVINLSFNRQFGTYLETRMQDRIAEAISQIADTWKGYAGWDVALLSDVLHRAANDGISISVTDSEGKTVLSGPAAIRGRGLRHMRGMMPMLEDPPGQAILPEDVTRTIPLVHDGKTIGSVTVSAPGTLLNLQDEAFLSTVNRVVIMTGAVLLLLGLSAAYLAASRIGNVFGHMTGAAERIGAGQYGQTMSERSGVTEIQSLMDSINRLSLALEKQESLRKRLFSDVAHDLRTPVTILISHLDAIRDGIWEPDQERMAVCMEEANQLARLIAEVEKLARLDEGETVLHPDQGDLMPIVRQSISAWKPVFLAKQVELLQTGTLAAGLFEPESVGTILNNLLSNALRHTRAGGAVTVDTRVVDAKVHLSVRDTGIGIPAADLPHIFERFYRADNSRSGETGGSGIGLAIVRALLDAQGGTIRVESEMGAGTTFTVELPSLCWNHAV